MHFKIIDYGDGKAEFLASLLKSSVSGDPSEIILFLICLFGAQETFVIIINFENSFCLIFCGKCKIFFKQNPTDPKLLNSRLIIIQQANINSLLSVLYKNKISTPKAGM